MKLKKYLESIDADGCEIKPCSKKKDKYFVIFRKGDTILSYGAASLEAYNNKKNNIFKGLDVRLWQGEGMTEPVPIVDVVNLITLDMLED